MKTLNRFYASSMLYVLSLLLLSACGGGAAPPTGAENTDGRFVAFQSNATNLVAGDLNGVSDVFVHDRETGATTRVSVDSAGIEGDSNSFTPVLSGDGRFVAFASAATNLVAGDSNGISDVFVRDRETGTTARVSVASNGAEGNGNNGSFDPAISADGRYVAFEAFSTNFDVDVVDDNDMADVAVHDRETGTTKLISVAPDGTVGDGASGRAAFSADGRYVMFTSGSANLIDADNNNDNDIFVHDQGTGENVLVSVKTDGTQVNGNSVFSPAISGDGRFVAFESEATNLVANDNNGVKDVFVHDRDADQDGVFDEPGAIQTVRVSVASDGTEGNNTSELPDISADGRYVAFQSDADSLVPDKNNSTDIFVHDRETGITERVSVQDDGLGGVMTSTNASISADGRFVAFASLVETLVDGDDNLLQDIFVRDRTSGTTVRVNVAGDGAQANGTSDLPAISADGR